MSTKNEEIEQSQRTILVYCVVRYGQIIGCYKSMDDACQVQANSIAKGQLCDLVVKPLM